MLIHNTISMIKATSIVSVILIMMCCSNTGNYNGDQPIVIKKSHNKPNQGKNRAPGEYIVTVREGSDDSVILNSFSSYGLIRIKSIHKYKGRHTYLIKLKKDPGIEELEKRIRKSDMLLHIQPNYIYRINRP
ncbi:MAG: hypothetical protein SVZ03_06795 [Spirochaetota bacterium]|nr:hypothetical protein [Spirochaetota bacterium]